MSWLSWIQWPAMVLTVAGAFFAASQHKRKRMFGFWTFLASNVLWVAWGWTDRAWALVILQIALAAMNLRGVMKNETAKPEAR